MPDGSSPRTDIGVCLFLVVICAAVLVEEANLPPGSFEPLGSAPIPQATAGLIIFLCLVVMARAAIVLARGTEVVSEDEVVPRNLDAAVIFGMTLVYVLLMALRVAGFALITSVFIFLAIAFLTRFAPRSLPVAAGVGVVMGYGCQYIFTQVFVVDLPAS
ncbi:MAG: tripartite tricarboxylate transporter TctB family protein [Pseudomonadota bacterium]